MQVNFDIIHMPECACFYHRFFSMEGQYIFMGLILLAMAAYFYWQIRSLLALKRECTEEVTATITAVFQSRSIDGYFGSRGGMHYRACYRYEYNDSFYESRSLFYGRPHMYKPQVGDIVTICINPFDPMRLYDAFTDAALQFYTLMCVTFVLCGLLLTVGQLFW